MCIFNTIPCGCNAHKSAMEGIAELEWGDMPAGECGEAGWGWVEKGLVGAPG